MIIQNLPKIIKLEMGEDAKSITSDYFELDNYRVIAFLFENTQDNELKIKIQAQNSDDNTVNIDIPFLFKSIDSCIYEQIEKDGKVITENGAFTVLITADMLSHNEYSKVRLVLESEDNISTVYVLLSQPRYTNNE